MNPTILVLTMLFIILISMQYTLNKILFELRQIRRFKEREPEDRYD